MGNMQSNTKITLTKPAKSPSRTRLLRFPLLVVLLFCSPLAHCLRRTCRILKWRRIPGSFPEISAAERPRVVRRFPSFDPSAPAPETMAGPARRGLGLWRSRILGRPLWLDCTGPGTSRCLRLGCRSCVPLALRFLLDLVPPHCLNPLFSSLTGWCEIASLSFSFTFPSIFFPFNASILRPFLIVLMAGVQISQF